MEIFKNPGPEVINISSCSTQLCMKNSLLINMKMPTLVGTFIFISREIFMLSYVKQEKRMKFLVIRDLSAWKISCSVELSMNKVL